MTSKSEYRKVEDYLALPYTIEITRDSAEEGSGWFAKVVELPGCMTQVENLDELNEMITDATRAWIETAIEEGISIPEPRSRVDFSGKFVVRVPKSLHKDLAEAAERDGVSLNAYVNTALAKVVGESRGQYHQA
jgi:antitoxin HicB